MVSRSMVDHEAMDRRVEAAIGAQLRYCAGNRRRIERRLRELEDERDIESVLDSQESLVASLATIAGAVVNRKLPSVPVAWPAALVRLAANRLPLAAALRRIGLRTSREIEIERVALRLLRGDLVSHRVARRPLAVGEMTVRY
jgi:hypothetical protein